MKVSKKKLKKKIQKKLAPPKKAKTRVKAKTKIMTKPKTKVKAKAKAKPKAKLKPKAKAQPKKILKKAKAPARKAAKPKKIVKPAKPIKPVKRVAPQKRSSTKSMFGPVDVQPYSPKKNEEYMSKKQLGHFQKILAQWKEQLMEDVDRTMNHMKDEASNYPDPVDRASQEEEFSLELRTRDRERKLLKKIEETLLRINDQDYGYCDDCGAEIGLRRLEARPTATQCIECKTIAEIREKQIGEGGGN
ncbi:MAG: RNA polymerase-binding transcription factor [uncultured bacterium]|nr:MAG: RNA polymerase-binding transcription factor [uncultured bacterium]